MTQRDFYLDLYAKGIGGPDTHVADPPTFARFLLQKASEFDDAVVHGVQRLRHLWQVDPNAPSGSPLTISDQQTPTTFRGALETPAFQSYLSSAVTNQLPETFARPLVENLTSPLGIAGGASAPARAVGSVALGLLAEEAARRAGAPPTVQTVAGLGGGVLGGAPELVPATGRLALRGAQAAGKAAVPAADRALNVAQGRQVAHAATEGGPLFDAWEAYDNTGTITARQLADRVEELVANEQAPRSLQVAVDKYRRAIKDDFDLAGRSDLDSAENDFTAAVRRMATRGKQSAASPVNLSETATVDIQPIIRAATDEEATAIGGKMVSRATTNTELRQIQAALKARIGRTPPFSDTIPPGSPLGGVPPPIPPALSPPVPPAPPPPTAPPTGSAAQRPSGIESTLAQASAIVERDRPGPVNRAMGVIPGVKQAASYVQPALVQTKNIRTGWIAEGLARGKVETALQQSRIDQLAQLDTAFGKGATATRDFKPAGVAFKGTPEQAKYPYTGTLADIMTRPSLYELSPQQASALSAVQQARSAAFQSVKAGYGLDIGEFPVESGGVHLPNVDVSEAALEMTGDVRGALRQGRTKERFYATAADRWAHDPSFRPETTVSKLLAANDATLTGAAGHNTMIAGFGGKTRLEVMQETHPELAAKMAGLQARLQTLRAAATRLGGKQSEAIDAFLRSPLDPEDLATLQADLNPTVGKFGKPGPNYGKDLKTLRTEVDAVKTQIAEIRPAWRVANLKPYRFVQEGVYRYFPAREASQIERVLSTSDSAFFRFVDQARATAFGGDFSPVTIQGATAWFSDPIGTSRSVAGQGEGLLTRSSLLADMKANPESWQRFTAATGINPLGPADAEFSSGFLARVPKAGKLWEDFNNAVYRPITRLQKDVFESSYQAALKRGLTPEQAGAIGADDATKIIPRSNYRRLGQSQADAAHYRAAVTSVSFLTQPVNLINDAMKGLVKLGTKQTISPAEAFAVRRVLTIAATTEAIAIISNQYYAQTHGLDPVQAIKDSLAPNSGKFMSLIFPNGARVGLGGPFRGIIRAIAPNPVPFAGIGNFAMNKIHPTARIALDEIRNQDYYGNPIRTGQFPVNILQGLGYALEGTAPLTVGSAAQQASQGATPGVVAQQAASQALGTNYNPVSPKDVLDEQASHDYGASFADLEPYQRKEVQKAAEAKMPQQMRGDPRSRYFARVKELDAIRLKEEAALVAKYKRDGNKFSFTNGYFDAQTRMQAAKDETAHSLRVTFDDQGDIRSPDPNVRALAEYYALFERTREQAGTWDSNLFERLLAEQDRKWTHEQGQYILRNSNMTEHAPGVIQLLPSATRQRIAKSEQARAAYGRRKAA